MRFVRFALLAAVLLALGGASAQADPVTGNITVYQGSTFLGYVSTVYDSQNSFTYTTNVANALQVQINTPVSAPFSMLEVNPPGPNHYFGGVGGSGGYYFSSGTDGYAYLTGTALTPAGATTSSSTTSDLNSLGYSAPVESTIWSVSGSNNVLSAQWVNNDGTMNPTYTYYDPSVNFLGLLGSLSNYNTDYNDGAYLVQFRFTGTLPSSVPEPGSLTLAAIGFVGLATVGSLRRRKQQKRSAGR